MKRHSEFASSRRTLLKFLAKLLLEYITSKKDTRTTSHIGTEYFTNPRILKTALHVFDLLCLFVSEHFTLELEMVMLDILNLTLKLQKTLGFIHIFVTLIAVVSFLPKPFTNKI